MWVLLVLLLVVVCQWDVLTDLVAAITPHQLWSGVILAHNSEAEEQLPRSLIAMLRCEVGQRVQWQPGMAFAEWASHYAVPLTFTDTRFAAWRHLDFAMDNTGRTLASRATSHTMHNIYIRHPHGQSRRQGRVFSYWHRKPLEVLLDGGAQVRDAIDVLDSINATQFFETAWGDQMRKSKVEGERLLYYSNPIEKDFSSIASLLDGTQWLRSKHEAQGNTMPSQTNVWIGGAGISTPVHNDAFDNFYVQLSGTKRFVLFPPWLHRSLHLFPSLHPKHQQSQVLLEDFDFDQQKDTAQTSPDSPPAVPAHFPNFLSWTSSSLSGSSSSSSSSPSPSPSPFSSSASSSPSSSTPSSPSYPSSTSFLSPLVVDLHPGEVLFIPELWFHHVSSLSPSLSINVWTRSTETAQFTASFERADAVQAGCLLGKQSSERAMSARQYLVRLLGPVLRSMETAQCMACEESRTDTEACHVDAEAERPGPYDGCADVGEEGFANCNDGCRGDYQACFEIWETLAIAFVRDNVLVPRYFPLLETQAVPSFGDPMTYAFCKVPQSKSEFTQKETPPLKQTSCAGALQAQVGAFRAILHSKDRANAPQPRPQTPSVDTVAATLEPHRDCITWLGKRSKVELRLADVVEFAAYWAVSAAHVSTFLLDFVRC